MLEMSKHGKTFCTVTKIRENIMEQAVIIDAARTPMGRSKQGIFRNKRADEISAHILDSLIKETQNRLEIDDIHWDAYTNPRTRL